jgi:Phosphoglycerol transferase and related proteins, alkaline phosphatase superfamily
VKERVLYLVKFYVATVLIFLVAKVCFMLYHHDALFTVGDIFDVLRHGLSLDLSTSLYLLTVPFLLTIISLWVRIPKPVFRVYYFIAALLLALAFVADTSLYEFWKFKLDASCLQYLETPTEAMASVSTWYILFRLVVIILLTIAIYWIYVKLTPLTTHLLPLTTRLVATIIALLLIPLMVIGIRGGIDESTTNIGQVYYSQNQFLNHAAVNPVFSFFASFEKSASNNTIYNYMDDEECEQIIKSLYNTESIDSDTLLNTQTPNIIIILLEGCGGEFTEIGGRKDITPNLNRLAQEGIYFSNCYGNSWRTDRGTVCTWSGYPSFPTMSVMKIPSKSRSLPNIARTLKEQRGYQTYYVYGGDINFTNMRSYLVSGGFETLKWKADYTKEEQESAQWGVRDDITFDTVYDLITTHSTLHTPHSSILIGYSTLSSHAPWDVPIRKFDDEILNAMYYLDQCLGDFIQRFRQTKEWDNTLVILLPDHGIPYKDIDERHPLMNHIPMIWVGGAVKAPLRIEQVCNQTDLPATLLGQLGLSHDDFTFSRDVLSKSYTQPFAINTYTEGFSVNDSVGYVNYDLIGDRICVKQGEHIDELLQRGRALLQAASKDLDKR